MLGVDFLCIHSPQYLRSSIPFETLLSKSLILLFWVKSSHNRLLLLFLPIIKLNTHCFLSSFVIFFFQNRSVAIKFAANSAVGVCGGDLSTFAFDWFEKSLIMINSYYFFSCSSKKRNKEKKQAARILSVNFASKICSYFVQLPQIKYLYEVIRVFVYHTFHFFLRRTFH